MLRLLYQFLIEMCRNFHCIKLINDESSIWDTFRFVKVKSSKGVDFRLTF